MKLGIITLFGLYNYGNRLQNLAVNEIFKRYDFDVETIVCENLSCRKILKLLWLKVFFWTLESKKNKAFKNFNSKFLKIKILYRNDLTIPKSLSKLYDVVAVGSDQVWNPEIRKREKNNFYLKFAPPSKRICISPSLGISNVCKKDEQGLRDGLKGFKYLCCREKQGSSEISRITGRPCETLIDPTLVLDSTYWKSIADYSMLPNKKFIVMFFLGYLNPEVKDFIVKYAEKNNFLIINILDHSSELYGLGPEVFLALIDKAEIVFTDSFHAVAFSLNMNTPFYAFDRVSLKSQSNMNSRILSLLSICSLENRFVESGTTVFEIDSICNFDFANIQLIKERDKFNLFVSNALKSVINHNE